ncbi:hypothetical protein LINPERPRIM_LOCUS27209 [Linum perenne]
MTTDFLSELGIMAHVKHLQIDWFYINTNHVALDIYSLGSFNLRHLYWFLLRLVKHKMLEHRERRLEEEKDDGVVCSMHMPLMIFFFLQYHNL